MTFSYCLLYRYYVLSALANRNELVRDAIGHEVAGNLKASSLRAFRQDGGYWSVVNNKLTWKKPRVQMIYTAVGGHGDQALISVEGSRSGFTEEIDFVSVDLKSSEIAGGKQRSRVLVKGSEEYYSLADELRDSVNFIQK